MKKMQNIKIKVDMYDDTKFKIIDTKPERDMIHYIWTRMLTLAGKVNLDGELYLSRNIPYSDETLAIEFNRDVMQVRLALKVFMELEMITVDDKNVYKVKNFSKYQKGNQNKRITNNEEKHISEDDIRKKNKDMDDEIGSYEGERLISKENGDEKETQCDELNKQENDSKSLEGNTRSEKIKTRKRKTAKVESSNTSDLKKLKDNNKSKKRKNQKSIYNKNVIETEDDKDDEFIEFYDGDSRPLGKNEKVIMEFRV